MRHLTEAEILAIRDGEAAEGDAGRRAHVAACTACSEALEAARDRARRIDAALPPAPPLEREALERARGRVRARVGAAGPDERGIPGGLPGAAGTGGRTVPPGSGDDAEWREPERRAVGAPGARGEERARQTRREDPGLARPAGLGGAWSLPRAAGLLLLLAGGAAALPGSPIRSWLAPEAAEVWAPTAPASPDGPSQEVAAEASVDPETGIRLRVVEGPVEVIVEGAEPGTRLEVERGDGPELEVRAPEGSRFASAEGRVVVRPEGGPVRVSLPADAVPAAVRVGMELYLTWDVGGPEVTGPAVEREAERFVFEVGG